MEYVDRRTKPHHSSVLMAQCGPSCMLMLMLKGWLIVRKALLQLSALLIKSAVELDANWPQVELNPQLLSPQPVI